MKPSSFNHKEFNTSNSSSSRSIVDLRALISSPYSDGSSKKHEPRHQAYDDREEKGIVLVSKRSKTPHEDTPHPKSKLSSSTSSSSSLSKLNEKSGHKHRPPLLKTPGHETVIQKNPISTEGNLRRTVSITSIEKNPPKPKPTAISKHGSIKRPDKEDVKSESKKLRIEPPKSSTKPTPSNETKDKSVDVSTKENTKSTTRPRDEKKVDSSIKSSKTVNIQLKFDPSDSNASYSSKENSNSKSNSVKPTITELNAAKNETKVSVFEMTKSTAVVQNKTDNGPKADALNSNCKPNGPLLTIPTKMEPKTDPKEWKVSNISFLFQN